MEYLLLAFSIFCLYLALIGAIILMFFPEFQDIDQYLQGKKIFPSPSNGPCIRVENDKGEWSTYPLTSSSFYIVFSRSMRSHQVDLIWAIWNIKPFEIEFKQAFQENIIAKIQNKSPLPIVQIKWDLPAKKMQEALLELLKDPQAKGLALTPLPLKKPYPGHYAEKLQTIPTPRGGKKLKLELPTGEFKTFPLIEKNLVIIFQKFVPDASLDYCIELWRKDPFHLLIKSDLSQNTFGVFSTHQDGWRNVISIKSTLSKEAWLLTLIHEIAHLRAYRKEGTVEHSKIFYKEFKQLMEPLMKEGNYAFNKKNKDHLKTFFLKPNRFSALDEKGYPV